MAKEVAARKRKKVTKNKPEIWPFSSMSGDFAFVEQKQKIGSVRILRERADF